MSSQRAPSLFPKIWIGGLTLFETGWWVPLLFFGWSILQTPGLSLCLPLCIHIFAPWKDRNPYVFAFLFCHLICTHLSSLLAEVVSTLSCWADVTTHGHLAPSVPKWWRKEQAQQKSRVMMDRVLSAAVVPARLRERLFPWLGHVPALHLGPGMVLPNTLVPGIACLALAGLRNCPSWMVHYISTEWSRKSVWLSITRC